MSIVCSEVFEKGVELASAKLEILAGSPPLEVRQKVIYEVVDTIIGLINQGGGANISLAVGHVAALGQVAAGFSPSSALAFADKLGRRSIPLKKPAGDTKQGR